MSQAGCVMCDYAGLGTLHINERIAERLTKLLAIQGSGMNYRLRYRQSYGLHVITGGDIVLGGACPRYVLS